MKNKNSKRTKSRKLQRYCSCYSFSSSSVYTNDSHCSWQSRRRSHRHQSYHKLRHHRCSLCGGWSPRHKQRYAEDTDNISVLHLIEAERTRKRQKRQQNVRLFCNPKSVRTIFTVETQPCTGG